LRLSSPLGPALTAATLCLLLAACGGGGTTTVTVTAGAAEEAEDGGVEAGAKAAAGGLESFQSPSGNIGCYIGPEGARCDIVERSWTAPRPGDCPSQVDAGQGLEVGQSGPGRVVCAGDTALNPELRKLGYGADIHAGDFTCHSREDGVECLDDGDGRGFFISKQSYRLF
jgi:Family of unknown function (DUF6636)